MKTRLLTLFFLLMIWLGFSNNLHITSIVFGLFVATIIHFSIIRKSPSFTIHLGHLVVLILYMIWELIYSSLKVAWDIVTPSNKSHSEFVTVPLHCKNDTQISLLASLISLTPGTLAIDIIGQKSLIIHAMFAHDQEKVVCSIKEKLERKIMRAIQCKS